MTSVAQVYNLDGEIATFFSKTSMRREACDALAKQLVGGGEAVPVPVQGSRSYTVYAGQALDHVVQFRTKSFPLSLETTSLAHRVFGLSAPEVSFKQQLGDDSTVAGQEPLLVYVMPRLPGVTHIEFILAHGFPENSPENKARRKVLVQDFARFFALAWKAPQKVNQNSRDRMSATFEKELQQLLASLPDRFHPIIRATLAFLPRIFALPMVLTHKDLGLGKVMVHEASCHFGGAAGWDEAEIAPFGTNPKFVQDLMSKLHLKDGWIRYEDYDDLTSLFWETFTSEVGGLDKDTLKAIKAARVLGLLRTRGFTPRVAGFPAPAVPVKLDEDLRRYNLMILDGLLLDPATRFEELHELLG
ncbi:hypothetical protein RB593_001637 [Gaeumannomyces tritici]